LTLVPVHRTMWISDSNRQPYTTVPSVSSRLPTIIYPLFPMGIRRVERRKPYLLVRLAYTPTVLFHSALAWFFPSLRLCASLSSSCFPVPMSHVLFRPCPDCAHHTPLFSYYFTSTGCFVPGVLLSMCLVCILLINLIPFNSCIYRGPADTLTQTTSPPLCHLLIPFGCLPSFFEFCYAHFRFFLSTSPQ
jgi:hypothetical protein